MRGDGVGVEVGVAAAVRRVGVRRVQPRCPRSEGAVDEQVPASPRAPVIGDQALGLSRSVTASPQYPTISTPWRMSRSSCQSSRPPMSGPAHSWTATIPLARPQSRAAHGAGALLGGQPGAGGGAHQVVGVGGQRPLRIEPLAADSAGSRRSAVERREWTSTGPGRRAGRRRRVEVVGARAVARRPPGLVPAVTPDRPVGMARAKSATSCRQCRSDVARAQIEAGEHQAGRGEVHVAVDEGGRDECAVEVDDLGVGKLGQADVVAAEPDDVPSRTAIAVASGMAGLWIRPPRSRWSTQSGCGGNAVGFDVDDVDHSHRRCSRRARAAAGCPPAVAQTRDQRHPAGGHARSAQGRATARVGGSQTAADPARSSRRRDEDQHGAQRDHRAVGDRPCVWSAGRSR
jgi:hypothetical protein